MTFLIQLTKLRKLSSGIDGSSGDGMDGGSGNDRVIDGRVGDDKVGNVRMDVLR